MSRSSVTAMHRHPRQLQPLPLCCGMLRLCLRVHRFVVPSSSHQQNSVCFNMLCEEIEQRHCKSTQNKQEARLDRKHQEEMRAAGSKEVVGQYERRLN